MTLEEAIGKLNPFIHWNRRQISLEDIKAIQLGIEALERLKDLRKAGLILYSGLLPSETEGGEMNRTNIEWVKSPDQSGQPLSLQYIAGFFDGEGSAMILTIRRQLPQGIAYRFRPVIKIHQKTRGVLAQIMNTVGYGHIDKEPSGFAYIINGLQGVLDFADMIGKYTIVKHESLVAVRALAKLQRDNHRRNQPYSRLLFQTLLEIRETAFRANQRTRTGLKQKYPKEIVMAEQHFIDDIDAWQKNRMRGIHHE